ncbi:uncharacterized protein BDZ99DRAFT_470838 [Mytilinidion resinicola]|uniref:Uncharacterized protein n=1 Tax=Mytilinidion resinicola TaxID=574789 RepID=A0A6A6ZB17_9PEZI|nr:uncharacterized protein BDZ99DRAFT_470838 [Mytilinidion resinicola]KAF2817889.1 hypothetical protein BDZ99DRAFT_470838 [Mytilinidion resinicola]
MTPECGQRNLPRPDLVGVAIPISTAPAPTVAAQSARRRARSTRPVGQRTTSTLSDRLIGAKTRIQRSQSSRGRRSANRSASLWHVNAADMQKSEDSSRHFWLLYSLAPHGTDRVNYRVWKKLFRALRGSLVSSWLSASTSWTCPGTSPASGTYPATTSGTISAGTGLTSHKLAGYSCRPGVRLTTANLTAIVAHSTFAATETAPFYRQKTAALGEVCLARLLSSDMPPALLQ